MDTLEFVESAFQVIGHEGPLIGVHCAPQHRPPKDSLTVVIVASQPQTRIGAHRMFVELARRFAASGISSVRFDCSGWGDSLGPAKHFEESKFDILTVVRAIQSQNPSERIALLGLRDGATAAWLSLPLLRADQREVLALILINPWIDQENFEAKGKLSDYYLERLKSPEFWGKLVSGRVQVGGVLADVVNSIKVNQEASSDSAEQPFTTQLLRTLDSTHPTLVLALSETDPIAEMFSAWLDHEDTLQQSFSKENVFRHPTADHTFSDDAAWLEACQWMTTRLQALLPR